MHVESFMDRCRLWPVGSGGFVGVSGGQDSILLLWTLFALLRKGRFSRLKVFHINHGTRQSCDQEEVLITKLCRSFEIPFEIKNLSLDLNQSNFEHIARQARNSFFRKKALFGDRVYVGHHLDDSLEWSLLCRFKSGSPVSQIGIPVVNGPFARPFLCVSRRQIEYLVKYLNLEFLEDPSNRDIRFDRNFLRQKVLVPVKKRFPGYLRHYVAASNEMAKHLGVWRPGKGGRPLVFKQISLPLGGVGLFHPESTNNFFGAEGEIRTTIVTLGKGGRGSLTSQIDKMVKAASKGRKGPFFFSGSVVGYMAPGMLFFVSKKELKEWEVYDRALTDALNKMDIVEELRRGMSAKELKEHMFKMPFPPMGVARQTKNPGGKGHPLLPKTSKLAEKKGLWFGYLAKWVKNGENRGEGSILPLDLLAIIGDFSCSMNPGTVKIKSRIHIKGN